jgi:glyceraldehyde-3-phosphate dehydrogenase type I
MIQAAINGFGRIGRCAFRVWLGRPDLREKIAIKAINTSGSMDVEGWAMLLKHDTAYGALKHDISYTRTQKPGDVTDDSPQIGTFTIDGQDFPVLAQRDPAKLPWSDMDIDLVYECTGVFRTEDKASLHVKAGAKRVLLSAPGKGGNIGSMLMGVQQDTPKDIVVASNASCTTNCVAPVMEVLHEGLGVLKAGMTTVHAYTDSQNIQDGSHKKDLYRARAAAANLVPTSTGAAEATTRIIPDLENRFDGMAIRCPVITGSISDITALVEKKTSIEFINEMFEKVAISPRYAGIIGATREPLVSSDVIGRSESCIVALPFTNVIDGDLVKILAWYDNEWGFSNRLVEMGLEMLS